MDKRITIVVHGRFHAFDLARELIKRGNSVKVLTCLPPSRYVSFGLDRSQVWTFWFYGGLTRLLRLLPDNVQELSERFLKPMFSNWAARHILLEGELPDVIYCFSGVAEELFQRLPDGLPLKLLARGSTHIRFQHDLLAKEEERVQVHLQKPSRWMIDREEREYRLADRVIVLSTFAYDSFLSQGFDKVSLMLSGCQTTHFKVLESDVEKRVERVKSGKALNILTVGSFSYRKGAYDLVKVARLADEGRYNFRFVGDITAEAASLKKDSIDVIEFIPRVPHFNLPDQYKWADIFFFPTIEDGYPAVLAQAHSMGLPILATLNSSAPDIIHDGYDGKLIPAGEYRKFLQQLEEWECDRKKLAELAENGLKRSHIRDWEEVALSFESIILKQ